jgi:adenylate cyclase
MSFFGGDRDAQTAAQAAILTLRDLWRTLAALSLEFEAAFDFPLRFGAGCHIGVAVVGGLESRQSAQFLGEVGNIAARLESHAKELACSVVLSRELIMRAGLAMPANEINRIQIPGVSKELELVAFRTAQSLDELISPLG